MRILLVDDQAHEIVSAFLELDGHEITTEANGDSAFQRYLAEGPFDLVLTDIEHPGMNGVDLMHAIHEKNPKQNVQIITAWPVLRKPFTKEQVLAFVKLEQNGPDSKPPTLDDIKSKPFGYGRPPEQVMCYWIGCGMTDILGCAELLQESKLSEHDSKLVQHLLRSGKCMAEDIEKLSMMISQKEHN